MRRLKVGVALDADHRRAHHPRVGHPRGQPQHADDLRNALADDGHHRQQQQQAGKTTSRRPPGAVPPSRACRPRTPPPRRSAATPPRSGWWPRTPPRATPAPRTAGAWALLEAMCFAEDCWTSRRTPACRVVRRRPSSRYAECPHVFVETRSWLTGQVTPMHSAALVDLVGRVPGAPPE